MSNPLQPFEDIIAARRAAEAARGEADRAERLAERQQRFDILREVLRWLGIPDAAMTEDRSKRGDFILVDDFYFWMGMGAKPGIPNTCILWEGIRITGGLWEIYQHPNFDRLSYGDSRFDLSYSRVIEQDRERIMAAMAYGMDRVREKKAHHLMVLNAPAETEDDETNT